MNLIHRPLRDHQSGLLVKYRFELFIGIILAVFTTLATTKPIGDFGNYYYGSSFLWDGSWGQWIYDPASFNLRIYALGQRNFFLNYTPVPPLTAVFYLPVAWMPVMLAKIVWNSFNALAFLIAFRRIHTYFHIPQSALCGIVLALLIPIRNNFNEGQSYLLILYLLVEGLIQYQKGNMWWMALAWAVCIHLKLSPMIVFAFMLINGSYKAMLQLGLIVALMIGISIPIISESVWWMYIQDILPRLLEGEINNPYATSYQSIQVLLKNLLVSDALFNPDAPFHHPWLYHKLLLLAKVGLLLVGLWGSIGNNSQQEKFGLWILIMLLITGYGNSFGLVFLMLPLAFFYQKLITHTNLMVALLMCLVVTTIIPYYVYEHFILPLRYLRLYGLLAILGILFCLSSYKIHLPLAVCALLLLFLPIGKLSYPQTYFLSGKTPLLMYDFSVVGQNIELNIIDGNGPSTQQISLSKEVPRIRIITEQQEPWRRTKRILVNDTLELFLSDVNRGVGFYTLHAKRINSLEHKPD